MIRTLLLSACLLGVQEPSADDLVDRLRSEKAEEREAATRALKALGPAALPALEKAEKDADVEVARRARHLVRLIRWAQRLTPRLKALFPGLEERLAEGGDREATKVFLQAVAAEGTRLVHPELTRDDLEPLAAAAVRGVSPGEEGSVCQAVEHRRLRTAAPELVGVLKTAPPRNRRHAFLALLAIGTPAEFPALRALADGADPDAALDALFILGRLGDRTLLPRALDGLGDPRWQICEGSAWALQDLGVGGKPERVLALLDSPNGRIRVEAVIVVRTLGLLDAIPNLVAMLKDPDRTVRYWAAYTLGQFRAADASAALVPLLTDEDAQVRQCAAIQLGELKATRRIPDLIRALDDPTPYVRISLVNSLARLRATEAVPALVPLLKEISPDLAEAAVRALEELQGREGIPALRDLLGSSNEMIRVTAAAALARLGDKEGAAELLRSLGSKSFDAAFRAVEAVTVLDAKEALPRVRPLLEYAGWEVRASAVKAIADWNAKEAEDAVVARLEDYVHDVRIAAAEALCRLGSPRGVATLIEQGETLDSLNLLRQPELVARLERQPIRAMFGANLGQLFERIAADAGLKAEWPPPSPDLDQWRSVPPGVWHLNGDGRAGAALRNLTRNRFSVVLESDRLRILSRADAERFWTSWASAGSGR